MILSKCLAGPPSRNRESASEVRYTEHADTAQNVGKHHLLSAAVLAVTCVTCASGVPPKDEARAAELAKWRAMIPKIENLLTRQGELRQPGSIRAGQVDAADFARNSFALVDACPLGAYTELIVAMRLDAGQPALAHFRKGTREIDMEFSRGASVMHGKNVKLVLEKHAIYDISWDNDGMDSAGTVRLEKCVVDAYIWNTKAGAFDYDQKLTNQATQNYCHALEHQAH